MRVLHCSDIHLGKRPFGTEEFSQKRYNDYFLVFAELIEKAIQEDVDIFMITGDLFDKREITPDILGRSEVLFQKLSSHGIKVFITEGNHDNSNRYDSIDSWLNYLQERKLAKRLGYEKTKKNSYIFDVERVQDVNFYGLGYPGFNIDNVVTALSEELNPLEKNIVMVHTAIGSSDSTALPGLIRTETLNLLKGKAIYVGGGHYHSKSVYPSDKREEKPFFFIPGSTEYWNVVTERGDEKGAYLFDTDTEEYKFVPLTPRKRIKSIFRIESLDGLEEDFVKWCQALRLTGEELVIMDIIIPDYSYINTKELENILEEAGALKGYIVPVFAVTKSDEAVYEGGTPATAEEIERSLIGEWHGLAKSRLGECFKDLKEIQREKGEFHHFYEILDEVLEDVIKSEDK